MKASRTIFYVCLAVSIGLIIGGFFVPPMGVIDGSVLTAVGEIFGFAALAKVPEVFRGHKTVELTHGNTTISVKDKDETGEG